MTTDSWLLFVITETALCLTPGPAVLLVVSQALVRGTAASVGSNVGVLAANAMYFALSATGVGALMVASHEVFLTVRWLGAAYLVAVGVAAFRGTSRELSVSSTPAASTSVRRTLLNGFVLQAANPKALVFFVALLPQFIDPRHPVVAQVAILGATSVAIEFLVLLAYGAAAGRATGLAKQPRFRVVANRVAGSFLIAAGVGVARLRSA